MWAAMEREVLRKAWARYYQGLPSSSVVGVASSYCESLVGRMRVLGSSKGHLYKGFNRRELNRALSIAVSVHKQALGRLTSVPRGGILRGGGGV